MDTKATTNSLGGGATPTERLSSEETVRLGRQIYERDIRRQVEADHVGKIVAIDVESGIWAMGHETMDARESLRAKRPEALNVLFERVGYRTVASMGGGLRRRTYQEVHTMDTKATTNSLGGGVTPTERLSSEETVRLGREIYERDIRHQVEADHVGKIVAIDAESGSWAMGDDELAARTLLRTKRPEAVDVLFERVGYLAAHSMGGGLHRRAD